MSTVLAPPPIRTAISGPDGMPSAWVQYFQAINDRVGGPVSQTLTQVASSVTAVQASVTTLNGQVAALNAGQATLNTKVATLTAGQTTQAGQIAAIQGQLAPGISATIATAKLTVGGVNGSMTFTNGILTAQVQAT